MKKRIILLLVTASLIVIGTSLAQEIEDPGGPIVESTIQSGDENSSPEDGQTMTGVDSGTDTSGELENIEIIPSSFSGEHIQEIGEIGDLQREDSEFLSGADLDPSTGNLEPSAQYALTLSEVYFDGTDEWIEVTNIGEGVFSGKITFSGAKSSLLTISDVLIHPGMSVVFGDNLAQISGEISIAKTGLSLNLVDTTVINIHVIVSGQIEDSFLVDQYRVNKYNDKKTSFEKVGGVSTRVQTSRVVNAQSGYTINPGVYFTTGDGTTNVTLAPGMLDIPFSCDIGDQGDLIKISEIFPGDEKYPPYIELAIAEDISRESLSISGNLLATGLEFLGNSSGTTLQKNSFFLVSSSGFRNDQGLQSVRNDDFSLVSTGNWLLITIGSGQTRQVMDIVYSSGNIAGKSSYFEAKQQQCVRIFDAVDYFSPGFDQKFLEYSPVRTVVKIEYASTSSQMQSGVQYCPLSGQAQTFSGEIQEVTNIPSLLASYNIHIVDIEYDPQGSDTNNEKVTLLATNTLGDILPLDMSSVFRLQVNGRNKTLSGILPMDTPTVFTKTFGFPNSTTSGQDVVVSLVYGDHIFDTYTYNPKKLSSQGQEALTTTGYYVSSVIDGDTFRIKYEGKTQNIRMLGIDAPESSKTRYKHLECFGTQAKDYLKSLIDKKRITFQLDPSQDQRDLYDRILAYVFLEDENINQTMIEDGYAKEYTYKSPYIYQSQFRQAEQSAQNQQVGLRSESTCGVSMSGVQFTGDSETGAMIDLSGLQFTITYVLPNPKGSDTTEELGLFISVDSGRNFITPEGGNYTGSFDLSQGFSLQIGTSTKKIKGIVHVGQENILSGSLGLVNKAACVSLMYYEQELAKFCYGKPKEGEKIYANNQSLETISQEDLSIINALQIKRIGNHMCIRYGSGSTSICKRIPASKAETKTINEKNLYKGFASLVKSYLLSDWKDIYYDTSLRQYYDLLAQNKKLIAAGVSQVDIYGQSVAVTNIKQQLQILQTTLPAIVAIFEGIEALSKH